MTENKRYSMKKRGGALFYFKDGVIMLDEDILFDLNMLNDTNNALKSDRHRFEEETRLSVLSDIDRDNEKIKDLILDAIVEMHDGKRDYAEKLLNEAIELIK
jgi:hypothetical protein